MLTVRINNKETVGPIKPMNAVNNGPVRPRGDQTNGNFPDYASLKIPFARNHDAYHNCPHVVDIPVLFPDFSADADDPASYDFHLTDELIQTTLDAGTQIFYRLGASIEHWSKKYNTLPPPDFQKWAVICEHVIRHYNEGWADGFHHNIIYWEIWNEPDLDPDDSPNKRNWGGTEAQYHELFILTAKHLKQCFPNIKVGGPALCYDSAWLERMLKKMAENNVPMDFCSFHTYAREPQWPRDCTIIVRNLLDKYGYTKTETILNEWNYVRGWNVDWQYSIRTMTNHKGATFVTSVMSLCQDSPLDMLMYYDLRPCGMNGVFDMYTFKRLRGYYAFLFWKNLVELGTQVKTELSGTTNGFACTGAVGKDGKTGLLLSFYWEPDELPIPKEVAILADGLDLTGAKLYCVGETKEMEEIPYEIIEGELHFIQEPNSFIYLEI